MPAPCAAPSPSGDEAPEASAAQGDLVDEEEAARLERIYRCRLCAMGEEEATPGAGLNGKAAPFFPQDYGREQQPMAWYEAPMCRDDLAPGEGGLNAFAEPWAFICKQSAVERVRRSFSELGKPSR